MVYYFTSGNVKLLRNIIIDYGVSREISPYEYMQVYIGKCSDNIEDAKLSWIVESFLGYHKHVKYLKEIASHMSEELSDEDQEYFMLVFYGVTFQLNPQEKQSLYKCLFNLSKPLLGTFTNFLSNNEVLSYLALVAQAHYDTNFITNKIVAPLFEWQPYISEMEHSYAEYVKKLEGRKVKPSTIPIQPTVLSRKGMEKNTASSKSIASPLTPPNSTVLNKKKKMLTKSTIDVKLKQIHDKNRQKAAQLLNNVKNDKHHYAQVRPNDTKKESIVNYDIVRQFNKQLSKQTPTFTKKPATFPVKETVATVKRLNKNIEKAQQKEVAWLENVMNYYGDPIKLQQITEMERDQREKENLIDIEKKHIMGLLSHEEAVLAKQKVVEENKKKYEEFLKEREAWNREIEVWKKKEEKFHKELTEKESLLEFQLALAKDNLNKTKKDNAEKLKKESEVLLRQAMKEKQEELTRRMNMIKEIKILALIAKTARIPKIIDLTQTSGIGLLCEMSLAELQERLNVIKIGMKEVLDTKRASIINTKEAFKKELAETMDYNKSYLIEQAEMRKQNNNTNLVRGTVSSKEIDELKKRLNEKRKMRMNIVN